jgi:hypothetical protein
MALTLDGTAGITFNNSTTQAVAALPLTGGTLTGNLVIGSGANGITFPATQSASSDANTLDDYEEGTWTTTFSSYSGGNTASLSNATYIKIGKQVTLFGYIAFTKTNGSTNMAYVLFTIPFEMNTGQSSAGVATGTNANSVALIAPYGAVTAKSNTYFLIPTSSAVGATTDSYMFSYTYQYSS